VSITGMTPSTMFPTSIIRDGVGFIKSTTFASLTASFNWLCSVSSEAAKHAMLHFRFVDCFVQLALLRLVGGRETRDAELYGSLNIMHLPCLIGFWQFSTNGCCIRWLRVHSVVERQGLTSCCSFCNQHLDPFPHASNVVIATKCMMPVDFNF
jgi:hypothetical protein